MNIREELKLGRPLLFDGAMGTLFAALSGRAEERCERANLDHPEEILAIHREAIDKVFCQIGQILKKGGKEAVLEAIGGPVCLSGFKRLLD